MNDLDLSEVPNGPIDEIHRQGELCLQGTLQLALAADQRATTTAGIFGAGAVALLAVAASLLGTTPVDAPFLYSTLTAAVLLFLGMTLCALAAQPVDFHIAGYEPRKLANQTDRTSLLRHASEDVQRRIDENRRALDRGGRLFTTGTLVGLVSPVIALFVYLLTRSTL